MGGGGGGRAGGGGGGKNGRDGGDGRGEDLYGYVNLMSLVVAPHVVAMLGIVAFESFLNLRSSVTKIRLCLMGLRFQPRKESFMPTILNILNAAVVFFVVIVVSTEDGDQQAEQDDEEFHIIYLVWKNGCMFQYNALPGY